MTSGNWRMHQWGWVRVSPYGFISPCIWALMFMSISTCDVCTLILLIGIWLMHGKSTTANFVIWSFLYFSTKFGTCSAFFRYRFLHRYFTGFWFHFCSLGRPFGATWAQCGAQNQSSRAKKAPQNIRAQHIWKVLEQPVSKRSHGWYLIDLTSIHGPTVGALNAESPKRTFSNISKQKSWSRNICFFLPYFACTRMYTFPLVSACALAP